MNFTVIWRPTAEQKLAEIWLGGKDRQAVADAANKIDSMLRSKPADVGESREGHTRILSVSPLAVYYDVHANDQLVVVWAVWRFRPV